MVIRIQAPSWVALPMFSLKDSPLLSLAGNYEVRQRNLGTVYRIEDIPKDYDLQDNGFGSPQSCYLDSKGCWKCPNQRDLEWVALFP